MLEQLEDLTVPMVHGSNGSRWQKAFDVCLALLGVHAPVNKGPSIFDANGLIDVYRLQAATSSRSDAAVATETYPDAVLVANGSGWETNCEESLYPSHPTVVQIIFGKKSNG